MFLSKSGLLSVSDGDDLGMYFSFREVLSLFS